MVTEAQSYCTFFSHQILQWLGYLLCVTGQRQRSTVSGRSMEDSGFFSRSLFLKLFFVIFCVFCDFYVVVSCVTSQVRKMDINQEKLEAILTPILDEVFDSKLNPIIQSLEFMSRQYDTLMESNKTLTVENKALKSKVGHLGNEISQI